MGTLDPHCGLRTAPSLLFPSASMEPVPWARTVRMQPLQTLPSAAAGPHGALGPRGKSDIDGGAQRLGKRGKRLWWCSGEVLTPDRALTAHGSFTKELVSAEL